MVLGNTRQKGIFMQFDALTIPMFPLNKKDGQAVLDEIRQPELFHAPRRLDGGTRRAFRVVQVPYSE
ncbi:MAG: hypothetical protein KKC85_16245 [Gammaproteobacteria bacterium]|nr:hypothetical protein [Gammaproteobacteria bacterium]MBU1441659.1 hypothetical protein [Gammaproteobacteria bacterium]MBU2287967.1 hypothetical protein [Gammaproteobacteria bacterium]